MMYGLQKTTLAVSLVFMLYANLLGGKDGARHDMYNAFPTAFAPAPFTFAIWAPIFLGCLALTVYLCVVSGEQTPFRPSLISWVAAAFMFTALTAYTPIGLSNLVVIGALVSLSIAFHYSAEPASGSSGLNYWCVRMPLAIFLAWTLVATLLNACQWLVSKGWDVGPVEASILIGLASLIGLVVALGYREMACAVVLIWAFWGIVVARPDESLPLVATCLGTACLVAAVIYLFDNGYINRN